MKTAIFILVLCSALLAACSGHTLYMLYIDGLSFVPEDQLQVISPVPQVTGLTLFILPGLQLDLTGSGPNASLKPGMKITAPVPGSPPDDVQLKLKMECEILLENMDSVNSIPATTMDVWIADSDSEDLYTQGSILFSTSQSTLNPLDKYTLYIGNEITVGDSNYYLIQEGIFRMGIRLRIEPSVAATVNIRYTLQVIDIEVSGKPFGFLP